MLLLPPDAVQLAAAGWLACPTRTRSGILAGKGFRVHGRAVKQFIQPLETAAMIDNAVSNTDGYDE